MSFSAGELVAILKLNKTQFTQAIKTAEQETKATGRQIGQSMDDASKSTDKIAGSLNQATAATRTWAASKIGSDKLADIEKLGVKTHDYIDAVTGVPGAQDKVRAALKDSGLEADKLASAYSDLDSATAASASQLGELGTAAAKSGTDTDSAATANTGLTTALSKATGPTSALDKAYTDMASSAEAAGTAAESAATGVGTLGTAAGASTAALGTEAGAAEVLAGSLGTVGAVGATAGAEAATGLAGIGAAGVAAAAGAETAAAAMTDVAQAAAVAEHAATVYAVAGGRVADELGRTKDNVVVDGTLAQAAVVAAGGLGSITNAGQDAKAAIEDMGDTAQSSGRVSTAAMVAVAEATDDAAARQGNLGNNTGAAGAAASSTGNAFKVMAGVIAGSAVVSYLKSAVDAGSDLNETASKSQQIFGAAASKVEEFGNTAAKSVGLSKGEAIAAAANFGNVFTQIGYTADAAADLSVEVVQMAADLGSFNNMPTADVADKISAAFNGEYDSLQAMIPGINAARVETGAMTASGKTAADQLTAQDKAAAVLAIVHKDGATAMGDYAKTADGFANSQKTATAEITTQQEALGQQLLPVVQTFMGILQSIGIPLLGSFGEAIAAVATYAEPVIVILGDVLKWVTDLPTPILVAVAAFTAMAILGPTLAGIGTAMAAMRARAIALGTALKAAFTNPIGIAITAIATAVAIFSSSSDDAAAATDAWNGKMVDLKGTLDQTSGAVTELTKKKIGEQIGSDTIERWKALGVNTDLAADAMLGADGAMDRASAQMAHLAGQAIASSESFAKWGTAVTGAGVSMDDLGAAMLNGNFDSINAQLATTGISLKQAADGSVQLSKDINGINTTTTLVPASGAAFDLAQAFHLTAGQAGLLTGAQADLATQNAFVAGSATDAAGGIDDASKAAADAVKPTEDVGEALHDGSTAADEMSDAIDILQTKLTELAGGTADAAEAQRAHEATIRAVAGAARDKAQAQADEAAAQQKITDLEKEGKKGTAEYEQAIRDAKDATDAVATAIDGQAASLDDLGESSREQVARSFETTEATQGYDKAVAAATETMGKQREQFIASAIDAGYSQEAAEELANAQGLIPGNVTTAYADIAAEEQKKKAENLKAAIDKVPAGKTITIDLKDLATVGIDGIAKAVRDLDPSKTITIKITPTVTATVNGGASAYQVQAAMMSALGLGYTGGMAGTLPGFAAGGMLGGTPPADPTVDNLLAVGPSGKPVRLRSREWIINQIVSDAMGPQIMGNFNAGKYPKAMFEGFAAGGSPAMSMVMNAPAVPVLAASRVSSGDSDSLRADIGGLRTAILQLATAPRSVMLAGGDVIVEADHAESLDTKLFRLAAAVR